MNHSPTEEDVLEAHRRFTEGLAVFRAIAQDAEREHPLCSRADHMAAIEILQDTQAFLREVRPLALRAMIDVAKVGPDELPGVATNEASSYCRDVLISLGLATERELTELSSESLAVIALARCEDHDVA